MHDWKTNDTDGIRIDFHRLAMALLHRWYIIIAAVVLCSVLAHFYTALFVPTTYRAGFSAYVNSKMDITDSDGTTTSELNSSIMLMRVYSEIIKSRTVLTGAAKECGVSYSYGKLSNMVEVVTTNTTPVIRVYVESENPEIATKLAAAIAQIAPQNVSQVVQGGTMSVIDEPVQPTAPYSPNYLQNTSTGAVVGLAASVLILVAMELIFDKVSGTSELESRYGIVVIGRIPDMDAVDKKHEKYGYTSVGGGRK